MTREFGQLSACTSILTNGRLTRYDCGRYQARNSNDQVFMYGGVSRAAPPYEA